MGLSNGWAGYDPAVSTNPVRDLHDAVARSGDPIVESTRPAATTALEMRRMIGDVIAKLQPDGMSVLEIGCGTGVLGVPIAKRAARYAGVDISQQAVDVLRQRLPTAEVRCADVTTDDLVELGVFDRVLVYATLHYVTTPDEGARFLRNALARLVPGGRALFGNLPLSRDDLPHSAFQQAIGRAWSGARRIRGHLNPPPRRPDPGALPSGYCLTLSRALIEDWLRPVPGVTWHWLVPRLGVPLQRTRADLIVEKDAGAAVR